ncbi:MAG TPA: helix-turn-helix domain-containing protein, partial [Terriglobales bacterium]|nr:helix-turn-helix domain-containing protein [Terriglobales bacterium]
MSDSFSTERLPISHRTAGWQGKARQICGDCRVQFPRHYPFRGSIDVRMVGSLELMRFSSSALSFTESPTEAVNSRVYCIVTTQLEGMRCYAQDGEVAVLEPGDTTLIDCARPWSSRAAGESIRLYLRVPREILVSRLRMSKLPIARRIAGNCGLGATLFQLATSMFREAELLKAVESRAALDAYFQILSACLCYDDGDGRTLRHGRELTSRILNFIETHLPEPTLDPQRIASAAGISVRHLHRVFAMQGRTVAEWIRQRRLEQCQRDLTDIRLRDRTITDIAFFWGFSDSAHFSRSFRKQFGIAPHAFRASALPKGWSEDESESSGLLNGMPASIPYP